MKMTNKQMAESLEALSSVKESGKLGYAIARNRRKIEHEVVEYAKVKQSAIEKYGDFNEESGTYNIVGDNYRKYMAELSQYDNIETEVDVMKVSLDEFLAGNLDSNQMYALDWMVDYNEKSE